LPAYRGIKVWLDGGCRNSLKIGMKKYEKMPLKTKYYRLIRTPEDYIA